MSAAAQVNALISRVSDHATADGSVLVEEFQKRSLVFLTWLSYLQSGTAKPDALPLLIATKSAALEAAACISLGLVRPALFSIRQEYELFLAWLYFNDHPVEWRHTSASAEDFPMRAQNLKYLQHYFPKFEKRLQILTKSQSSKVKYDRIYAVLSMHVHGTAPSTLPSAQNLEACVFPSEKCRECIEIQSSVASYLSDVALAVFSNNWADLPDPIKENVASRLSAASLKELIE